VQAPDVTPLVPAHSETQRVSTGKLPDVALDALIKKSKPPPSKPPPSKPKSGGQGGGKSKPKSGGKGGGKSDPPIWKPQIKRGNQASERQAQAKGGKAESWVSAVEEENGGYWCYWVASPNLDGTYLPAKKDKGGGKGGGGKKSGGKDGGGKDGGGKDGDGAKAGGKGGGGKGGGGKVGDGGKVGAAERGEKTGGGKGGGGRNRQKGWSKNNPDSKGFTQNRAEPYDTASRASAGTAASSGASAGSAAPPADTVIEDVVEAEDCVVDISASLV
jgi:hypothetical protein